VRWSWDSRLSFSLLALQPGFVTQVAAQYFGLANHEVQFAFTERRQDPVVTGIAASVAREALQVDNASESNVESLARVLTIHLLRNYRSNREAAETRSDSTGTPRAIIRALSFINQNHARNIGIADIAAAAHVSRFHLSRVFRNTLGITLQQYLIQARVQHAHALIVAGGGQYSLADIAVAAGFADQSHLTRHFKRQMGTTPKKAA
jgi:AraC family transcriptional regulator